MAGSEDPICTAIGGTNLSLLPFLAASNPQCRPGRNASEPMGSVGFFSLACSAGEFESVRAARARAKRQRRRGDIVSRRTTLGEPFVERL